MMKYNLSYIDPPSNDAFNEIKDKCTQKSKALKVAEYVDGILSPYKLETDDASVEVFDSLRILQYGVNSNVIYPIDTKERNLDESIVVHDMAFGVVWLGCVYDCWGHFITDALSKVWYLFSPQWKNYKSKGYKLAIGFFFSNIKQCPSPLLSLYKLLNILPEDVIVIDSPTHFQNVIVPDNSLFFVDGVRCYTEEYRATISYITDAVPTPTSIKFQKVYLSRRHLIGHSEYGEKGIEHVFKRLGYTIVHPEEMSLEDQIAMFQSSHSVVSTSGSLAHNTIFCKPHTEVVILRKMHAVFDYQLVINSLKELNVTYIDCHLSCFVNEEPNAGPFFIYINNNLVRFINDRYGKKIHNNFSWNHYSRYLRACCMRTDMKIRNKAPEYYYDLLKKEIRDHSIKKRLYTFIRPFIQKHLLTIIVNKFK